MSRYLRYPNKFSTMKTTIGDEIRDIAQPVSYNS